MELMQKRGETCVSESQLVLVSVLLIGQKNSTAFKLIVWRSKTKQITFWKQMHE